MWTGTPAQLKSFDYLGPYRYSLTFCVFERRRVFVHKVRVDVVLSQISRAAAEKQFAIAADCFMPDHVHRLVEGHSETSDCRRFIGSNLYSRTDLLESART